MILMDRRSTWFGGQEAPFREMRECVTGMEWTLNYHYIRDYNIYSNIHEIIEEAKCCN
jgi:hypothetical protein